jgi:hypothetical protein
MLTGTLVFTVQHRSFRTRVLPSPLAALQKIEAESRGGHSDHAFSTIALGRIHKIAKRAVGIEKAREEVLFQEKHAKATAPTHRGQLNLLRIVYDYFSGGVFQAHDIKEIEVVFDFRSPGASGITVWRHDGKRWHATGGHA